MMAIDIVVIRVRNTMLLLEHDGHLGRFDIRLTQSAAEVATKLLQKTLKGIQESFLRRVGREAGRLRSVRGRKTGRLHGPAWRELSVTEVYGHSMRTR